MKAIATLAVCAIAIVGSVCAQSNKQDDSDVMTVRGCLKKSRQNYLVVDKRGFSYALKGVGDKLSTEVGHEVEVKGKLTNDIKTGVRPEKQGSNPSDTVRGVDSAATLQVSDVDSDVRTIANKCPKD